MIKKYLLMTAMIYLGICLYAQDKIDMTEILNIQKNIQLLDNQILKKIKKHPMLSKQQGLRQFHVFCLETNEKLRKESFLDHSFLYNLQASYRPYQLNSRFLKLPLRKKKFLQTLETLICDSIGNLIATGYPNGIYTTSIYDQNDVELAKMFHEKDIDFVFYPTGYVMSILIAVKGNDIYILHLSEDGLKKYPIEEFIDCCYNEWIPIWEKE